MFCFTANLVRGDASVDNCTGTLIRPKSLYCDIVWSMSAAANYNTVRVLIFQWKDASSPLPTGVLQTAGPLAPQSMLSWVNFRKIHVLRDQVIELYDHGGGVCSEHFQHKTNLDLPPIQLPLSGAGAVPQMNGIYMLLISDDALAPIPVADVYTALMFTDA